CMQTLEFPYSF
nr:immunoglobulin light chain junction region [Macaca mulatta]MOX23585.1 immunoglobulin light chain junction region [Macaca mulatta]MOX23650.1 immunoglobulin light chain junction region [Macaca mulatta]MOX23672.1 immunoglobulin light chain junction region [Macaca mulatta]MOX23694.1 immunoglobulin light chain junction region [Macaca mulatta]